MSERFIRLEQLIGNNEFEKLKNSHVAVFGLGGVGSYTVEALSRCGIGRLTLVDSDVYSTSNINRQLYATTSTIGKKKIDVAVSRVKDVNPDCQVVGIDTFILPNSYNGIDFSKFDYIVDAIDTISGKLELIKKAKEFGVPIISSMGTGNKLDERAFKVADISKTKVCPLCRVMRKLLKENGIENVKVVYSEEEPIMPKNVDAVEKKGNGVAPSSISFVPAVAGLMLAGEVVRELIK